jgi:hypothetical protein
MELWLKDTVVYVWGYGRPTMPLFRGEGCPTEVAQTLAMKHGWQATREDAWVKEMTLPLGPELARRLFSMEARREPAVEGRAVRDEANMG